MSGMGLQAAYTRENKTGALFVHQHDRLVYRVKIKPGRTNNNGTSNSGVRRGGGSNPPPPPKFLSFDKVEPDCKLSRKCLVFLFQHPN